MREGESMSRHSLIWVVTFGIALALWALPAEQTRAEPPPEEDLSQGSWAPYPEDGTGAFGAASSGGCLYQTRNIECRSPNY